MAHFCFDLEDDDTRLVVSVVREPGSGGGDGYDLSVLLRGNEQHVSLSGFVILIGGVTRISGVIYLDLLLVRKTEQAEIVNETKPTDHSTGFSDLPDRTGRQVAGAVEQKARDDEDGQLVLPL